MTFADVLLPTKRLPGWMKFLHLLTVECGQNTDPGSEQNGDVASSRGSLPTQTDICSTLPITTEGYTELPAERADTMLQINTHYDLLEDK